MHYGVPLLIATLIATLAATAPASAQTPAPPAPADQQLISQAEATSILGRSVRDPTGDVAGHIVDVLVDGKGQPRAAIIDFGGFMGIGNRRIAVAWLALHFQPAAETDQIMLDLTADQIKEIPEYKRPTGAADPPLAVAIPPRPQ